MTRRFVGFAVFLACFSVLTAQEPKTAPKAETPKADTPKTGESIYPIGVGSKWTYIIPENKKEMTVTAARTEKIGTQDCVVLEAAVATQVLATEHIALVKDEYLRFRFNQAEVTPPLLFMKAGAKLNDSWKVDFEVKVTVNGKVESSKAEAVYTVSEEEVTVPAGKYQSLVVKSKTKENGQETSSAVWYAKGVGPVKQEFDFGGGNKFALELKSVEIKK